MKQSGNQADKNKLENMNKNIEKRLSNLSIYSTEHIFNFEPFVNKTNNLTCTKFVLYKKKFNKMTIKTNKFLIKSTIEINLMYKKSNFKFKYKNDFNPKRILTKPAEQSFTNKHDNIENNYIMFVNDLIGDENNKYVVLDKIGEGTFGQVAKCKSLNNNELVAIKIVKNNEAYFDQSIMEITILQLINEYVETKHHKNDKKHILKILNSFVHKQHLCIVFELLSVNLYDLIKQNKFNGLSLNLIKVFASQLLDALIILNEARIIHCDLKPENILLEDLESPNIKIIDFGSACHEQQIVYSYIQSRFYRSPEVILGLQ